MNDSQLVLMDGNRQDNGSRRWRGCVEQAVIHAIRAGFRIGREVRIGQIAGRVVGYNIGAFGSFSGASFPLLVSTDLGLIKCSENELAPV